uniref:Uncharacterized protein n=1 Tax=Arundo donax TaxID=35708 RepID=A0A0A9GP11_ARUDO
MHCCDAELLQIPKFHGTWRAETLLVDLKFVISSWLFWYGQAFLFSLQ